MTDNPKAIARRLRAMADELDPPPIINTPFRFHTAPPIVDALKALPLLDGYIDLGMTRQLAISTTARETGLTTIDLEVALSQRQKSAKWKRDFVVSWMTSQKRTPAEITAATQRKVVCRTR